jgi:hypothetical protein
MRIGWRDDPEDIDVGNFASMTLTGIGAALHIYVIM